MILVTGGAGFIGSVLVKKLNDLGRTDIVIVDRLAESSKWLNLRGLKYSHYIQVDEFFDDTYETIHNRIQVIFHMGACSSTTEMNMDYLMKNNVEYSKFLFGMAYQKDIPFIYASSAATYGAGELGYEDNENELGQLRPLNPYGYSKQLFDEWVLRQVKRPTNWFGLKFFNVYGPQEYHKGSMRSVVHQAYGQIVESGRVKLFKSHHKDYKDGEQLRDFVYAKDLAEAMVIMSECQDRNLSGIYNMGTGQARSFRELVEATFKAMDRAPQIDYIDMPEHLRGQYQYYTQANMGKFHKAFPDFTFMSLEQGVEDYIQGHLQTAAGPYF